MVGRRAGCKVTNVTSANFPYVRDLLSGESMDFATSNWPHPARWTRPDPRPRAITRLCCGQECLIVHLNVEIIFLDTGTGTWFCVQMWSATWEGSTLCGNGRTGDRSQAAMFR